MKSTTQGIGIAFFFAVSAYGAPLQAQGTSREIQITLFGQPCVLRGPVSEAALKSVHSISPEQISPIENGEQARRALQKIRSAKQLPTGLDTYRERLTRRLEAQLALYDGFDAAKKSRKSAPLLTATKSWITTTIQKPFQALAKKIDEKSLTPELTEQLSKIYLDSIEPDPEEEFHSASRKISVEYVCSFEEENTGGDAEE